MFFIPGGEDADLCLGNICGNMVTQYGFYHHQISPYR